MSKRAVRTNAMTMYMSKSTLTSLCREGFFILPYNELAIAQGPKIYQKKAL